MGCSACGQNKANISSRKTNLTLSTKNNDGANSKNIINSFVRDDCGYSFHILTSISLKCLKMLSYISFSKSMDDYKMVYDANAYITRLMAKMKVISACKYKDDIDNKIKIIEQIYSKYTEKNV